MSKAKLILIKNSNKTIDTILKELQPAMDIGVINNSLEVVHECLNCINPILPKNHYEYLLLRLAQGILSLNLQNKIKEDCF